jgi:aspartate ammonia-lyase
MNNDRFRIEQDSIGEMYIPKNAYYGIHSKRARENFRITRQRIDKIFIKSIAYVKKAAAIANYKSDVFTEDIKDAIVQACDEIINGKHVKEFITDPIQGGAGTSINMNANEVIANRALEILGHPLGDYEIIHPNDTINYGQSTNDVIPTAAHLAAIFHLEILLKELNHLYQALLDKADEVDDVVKLGRTHLQDAIPISMGQEFRAYARPIKRDMDRIKLVMEDMKEINIGATAVGTGLNADEVYFDSIVDILSTVTNVKLIRANDLIDSTRNMDVYVWASAAVKTCVVSMSKMSNDLRLMASGPTGGLYEIQLPSKQHGSSIMPGKVNPVIPEVMNQISFQVFGNDLTITKAAEAGQLELNVFGPVLLHNLFQSVSLTARGVNTLRKNAIEGLVPNRDRCKLMVDRSIGQITALAPHIGYDAASKVAKQAIKKNQTIRQVIQEEGLMATEDLDVVLNVSNMTTPGISGSEILVKKKKKKD